MNRPTPLQTLIRQQVQEHGRFIARLPRISAARTIASLDKDGYGTRLLSKSGNVELWEIAGEGASK